jgi:hypothetical protein
MNLCPSAATCVALVALLAGSSACAAENPNGDSETPARKTLMSLRGWPGEGVPVIAVDAGRSVPVYARPEARRPMKTVQVREAHTLEWEESRVLVLKFGRFDISAPVTAEICVYGGIDQEGNLLLGRSTKRELSQGERFDVVSYLAEGVYLFSDQDIYFEMFAEDKGRFLREPETEWWVGVELLQPLAGWVRVDGEQVKDIDRTF